LLWECSAAWCIIGWVAVFFTLWVCQMIWLAMIDKAVCGLPVLISNLLHHHLLNVYVYRPETKALTLEELDYGPSRFCLFPRSISPTN
jgi:hypothetical protein